MTVLRFDDNRGGLAYPFLSNDLQWQIVSRPFGDEEALNQIFQADPPTLRWVKDDKVLDLLVPDMDTDIFLARAGLRLSLHKGGYVLSKRLSRVMRRTGAEVKTSPVKVFRKALTYWWLPPSMVYHWGWPATESRPWLAMNRANVWAGNAIISESGVDQMAAPMGTIYC